MKFVPPTQSKTSFDVSRLTLRYVFGVLAVVAVPGLMLSVLVDGMFSIAVCLPVLIAFLLARGVQFTGDWPDAPRDGRLW